MSQEPYEEVNHRKRRRNRMRVSCLNCYASKRKCDRKRPCTRCIKHGLTGLCVYELDDPDTRDPSLDETTHLRNRIAELESVIRELNNRPHPRWFAPNGIEHVPELVAARRSSVASSSAPPSSSYPSRTSSLKKRKVSLRVHPPLRSTPKSEEIPNDIRAGTKRKYEQDAPETTRNASTFSGDAFFDPTEDHVCLGDSNKDTNEVTSHERGKNTHSDDSYCTDEDDDDDDEDYEEYGSRSYFKTTPKRSLNNRAQDNRHKRHKMFTADNAIPNVTLETSSVINPYRRTSASSSRSASTSVSSIDHKSTATAASPLTPLTLLSPISLERQSLGRSAVESTIRHSGTQSALGLVFNKPAESALTLSYPETGQDKRDDLVDEEVSSSEECPLADTLYPLRANVIWSNSKEKQKMKPKFPKSSVVSCQRPNISKKKVIYSDNTSIGRYVDAAVQTSKDVDTELNSSYKTSPDSCPCLSDTRIRNDVIFLITILRDTRNVLKRTHGVSETRQIDLTHDQNECELFKRISELDEYISAIMSREGGNGSSTRTQKGIMAAVATDDATTDGPSTIPNTAQASSRPSPGDRPDLSGLGSHSSKTADLTHIKKNKTSKSSKTSTVKAASAPPSPPPPPSESAAKKASIKSKAKRQRSVGGRRGRRGQLARLDESSTTTTPIPNTTTKPIPTNVVPTAPSSPAPTPASILERSLSRLLPNQLARENAAAATTTTPLSSTITLASILADTLGTESSPVPRLTAPPRFLRTPAPSSLPTPTFSPSSPLLRSTNSAIRRPDADFLPFYSYSYAHVGEADAERDYHHQQHHHHLHQHSRLVIPPRGGLTHRGKQEDESPGSSENGVSVPLNASLNFSPLLGNDVMDIGNGVGVGVENANDSSSHDVQVATATAATAARHDHESAANARPLGNGMTIGADITMDLDVDAEGEPAPESGYQYGYFEDGYRYEYVYVADV